MNDDTHSTDWLASPLALPHLTLPNRLVMAPMTRSFAPDGVPGPANAAYYRRRVEGGTGLIITEGTWVDHPAAGHDRNVPRFYGADALAGWAEVARAVHEAGGRIFPQLWHVGMERRPKQDNDPNFPNPGVVAVGPSGLPGSSGQPTNAMSEAEIALVVDAYVRAAASAQELGFDGVELHAAHGYLIDQFLRAEMNRRTDLYGGAEIGARTRFACEIVRAIRHRLGRDFPISFRFSQWRVRAYEAKLVESAEELEQMLLPLVEAGVDIFHVSTRRFWEPAFADSPLGLAGWTKKITGRTVITVGSVGVDKPFVGGSADEVHVTGPIRELRRQFEDGEFDLVALGRALLANPDWAERVHAGRADFAPFTPASRAMLV